MINVMKKDNIKNIDIYSLKWGVAPVPLLPSVLRLAWKDEVLPEWVCNETGLPQGSTLDKLDSNVWETMETISPRLKRYLWFLMKSRATSIRNLKCLDRPWPLGLMVDDISWSVRTRNCLKQSGLAIDTQKLINATFGELFKINAMGATSVLDFCATLECVVDFYEHIAGRYTENRVEGKPCDLQLDLEVVSTKSWLGQISSQDPRFAGFMPSNDGTLLDLVEHQLSEPDSIQDVANLPQLVESVKKIELKVEEIEKEPLEIELLTFLKLVSRKSDEKLSVLSARLGWDGHEPLTLEECGNTLGVTRERIRQIQKSFVSRLPKHEVFMPRLDEAIELLENSAPVSISEASKIVQEAGISTVAFHPKSIINTAEMFGKKTSLSIGDTRGGKMVLSELDSKSANIVLSTARKMAGSSGVASIFQLQDVLLSKGLEYEEDRLRRMLSNTTNFRFLDDDWFWATDIKGGRNRLCNVTRKILSVVSPQTLLNIRDGVRRHYRYRAASHNRYSTLFVPPQNVMKAFFEQHGDFIVEGDLVKLSAPLDYKKELGDTDRIMVEVLRSAPAGILDRASFADGCIARGMNENTFSIFATYSPVVEHVGVDIWKIRGAIVDPAAVEAMRIANYLKPREKHVLAYGWSEDGKLWIASQIPRHGKSSLVIGCPGAIKRYLIGQKFECRTKDGQHPCGTVVVNETGASYGYGRYVRGYGLDENDVLLAEFDLAKNVVTLSVSDEELLVDDTKA